MAHARLLDIAIREFGLKGLDGASTRGIAAAAGTAMSSITYHFGGKEGLYLAAADHIAARMAEGMADLAEADEALATHDPLAARHAIHRMLACFAGKMAADDSADLALFIMREQMEPSEAFDHIYGGVMGRMVQTLAELICLACALRDVHAARIVTITLMGQAVALRASRATCLKLLERETLNPADLNAIKGRIATNTDAILDRLIAEQRGH